jgi:hypothetical protein
MVADASGEKRKKLEIFFEVTIEDLAKLARLGGNNKRRAGLYRRAAEQKKAQ